METNRILAWIATIIALPAVYWLFATTAAGQANDARHDTALIMIQQHIIEAREEDREWKKSVMTEIGKMGDGFHSMGKEFSELKGVLNSIEFKGSQ